MTTPTNDAPAVSAAGGVGRNPQSNYKGSISDICDLFHRDPKPSADKGHVPSAVFAYSDEEGQPVGTVARFESGTLYPDKKTFIQFRYDPDVPGANALGFVRGMAKRVLPLYRLPEIVTALSVNPAQTVHIVEGEKCADALAARGLIATSLAGGSKTKIRADALEPLHGVSVVLWPDCDTPGREFMERLARALDGVATSARIVDLDAEQDDGFDVADFLNDGGTTGELLAMADAAPEWTPDDEPASPGKITIAPVCVRLSDVQPEPINWLWLQRMARGKLTLLVGDPGMGKSLVTLDLAARVSIGASWPDGSGSAPVGSVVLVSAEDDVADTIRPRLDAASANCERVICLQAVEAGADKRGFNLATDIAALRAAIYACDPPCVLAVIDPISAYLSGIDSHSNTDIRGVLAPLAALAAEMGVAILAVTHLRKGEGKAIYRAMGSLAFAAAARAVWCVTRDPQNDNRRLLLPVKNNIGNDKTGLAFTLESVGETARVVWEPGTVTISADDALAQPRTGHGESLEKACAFLKNALANGSRPARELFDEAEQQNISERTLKRAKNKLAIASSKSGGAGQGWIWALAKGATGEDLALFDKGA